jgi:hypothetical protein
VSAHARVEERPVLTACAELIEQLCACMRTLGARTGNEAALNAELEACREMIAAAQPPFSLRFLSDAVLRDREALCLTLGGFRRAQIIARMLHQLGTPELLVNEVPSREALARFVKLLVDATQGTHRSFAPKLDGLQLKALAQVDPTAAQQDESDVDRMLRAQLLALTQEIELIAMELARTRAWPWARGQRVIAALERCLAFGVTATARAQELGAGEWTTPRRALAATTQTLLVLSRLRVADLGRRAAGHAALALACAGLPNRCDFAQAAQRTLDALCAPLALDPRDEDPARGAPNPHRLRTTALIAACVSNPRLPEARLLHAAYLLEQKRIDERGLRLSRLDLQAWLVEAAGREVDAAIARAMLGALGALPPGSHVLSEGRLGVVIGPGKTSLMPLVLLGGEVKAAEAPVTPHSPLGMTPWAK